MDIKPQPPRVAHNKKLYEAWMNAHGNPPIYPDVSKQVELMPLNLKGLFQFGFNPSIIKFGKRLLMAYRVPSFGTMSTRLAISDIDDTWNIFTNKVIDIPTTMSCEDPRLFEFQGNLFMGWVEAQFPSAISECQTLYGMLSEHETSWEVMGITNPAIVDKTPFTSSEKNWVPFPLDEQLRFIYQSSPEQVIIEMAMGRIVNRITSPALTWKWGNIKGGTTPIPWKGKLLRFFHSTLDNEGDKFYRRYYIGTMLMEPEPPYAQIAITKKPLVYGSEDLPDDKTGKGPLYKGKVVFPGGAIKIEDGWLLSIGINDSQCAIVKLPEDIEML